VSAQTTLDIWLMRFTRYIAANYWESYASSVLFDQRLLIRDHLVVVPQRDYSMQWRYAV
jgi:hypothetical protein